MADTVRLFQEPMHASPVTVVSSRPVCSDSFNHPSFSNFNFHDETDAHKQATRPETPETPLPAAYTRQLSYGLSKPQYHNPNVYVQEYDSSESTTSRGTEYSLKKDNNRDVEENISNGKREKSVLIFLRDSRVYIRVIAVLIILVSLSLILTAVISFAKAQKKDGYPLDDVPKLAPITDHPCVVFSGLAIMNLVFSVSLLCASCMSSKFNKSNNALNATFTIISAVGFASSMGACHFLNKQTSLQNDLWKWSCGNHKKGITSDAIDFNLICNVVSYGWKFGLAQAALELLTFLISVIAFVLLKYSYFARYGRLGKVF